MRWDGYRRKRLWDGVGTKLSECGMEWVENEVSMGWSGYRIEWV